VVGFIKRRWKRIVLVSIAALLLLPLLSLWVKWMTRPYRYTAAHQVPPQRVAIIFGAGVRPDGSLTWMLADRVQMGVTLYQQGMVDKLLMTGDNSSTNYDEVTAMKRYAVEAGVHAEDITLDYAGFSTYESCYRARAIFGVAQAVLVTQAYHLPRSVYTCRHLGVDAVGVGVQDWGRYPSALLVSYTFREMLATAKALVDVHILHPLPTFLGEYEGIE
jgi:vancomycin permeability regulator SanA